MSRAHALRCERCGVRVKSGEHCSWSECNATGLGVALCAECVDVVEGATRARGCRLIRGGARLCVERGPVLTCRLGEVHLGQSPTPLSRVELGALARTYDRTSPVWTWLRARGVRRPSPSGPSGATQAESDRKRGQVTLRLDPAVAGRLRAVAAARGVTISALVADLVDGLDG